MKVYQMKLILGKEAQYNKDGKLKNQVVTPKYTGEMELENILDNLNWKKVGACEIECIGCIDYTPKTNDKAAVISPNKERMDAVNDIIRNGIKSAKKPKTAAQQLQDQSKMMEQMARQIEELKQNNLISDKSDNRITLEEKANELGISFRANIGDEKLLAKIVNIEPEFKNE